jgi:hypothetical protein
MAKRRGFPFAVLFLSVVLGAGASACGGDDDDDGPDDGADDGAGGGVDSGGGGGGADAGAGGCVEEPCLAPPEAGFQIRSVGTSIAPGHDVEYCEVVQLPGGPGDTYYVNRFESQMTLGSHHLIVSAIVPGSPTDENATVGERMSCIGARAFGDDLVSVTGQQRPLHEERFPAGVGRVFHGGQKLIFDYHYFNATDDDLAARAAVNFHTADEASIEHIAIDFSKYFFGLNVPAGESRSYDVQCRMNRDVMVSKLTRHTHQWGKEFPVSFNDGEGEPEFIYTSPNYEDPDYIYEEPVLVRAGQGFDFTCNYENDTLETLRFGPKATDEMCILFGTAYSPTARELPDETSCD